MTAHVRLSRAGDAEIIAPNLRKEDVNEIAAASGQSPLAALLDAFDNAEECYSVVNARGDVVAMFGTRGISPGFGTVWLLAADFLDDPKLALRFARESRTWVSRLARRTPVLANYVDARNTKTIRWLKWVGFQFAERPVPYGVEQRPFFQFQRTPGACANLL